MIAKFSDTLPKIERLCYTCGRKPEIRHGTLIIEIGINTNVFITDRCGLCPLGLVAKEARDDENTQERPPYPASGAQAAFARDDLIPVFTVELPFNTIKKQCK